MNLPVRFLDFPEEVQHDIFKHVGKDIDVMVTLLTVSQDTHDKMQVYVHNYLLEYGLERIVKKKNLKMLAEWKQHIFDSYPRGAIERQVIIAALHFLIGKYCDGTSIGRSFLHHFNPLVIDQDFRHVYSMGFMFTKYQHLHDLSDLLAMVPRLVENNAIVKHPLFGKMTLHTNNIKQVILDRLKYIEREDAITIVK